MIAGLAICAAHDRPGINPKTGHEWNDATAAFVPEAKAFAARHNLTGGAVEVDNRKPIAAVRHEVEEAFRAARFHAGEPLELVAIMCHGTRRSLQLAGSFAPGSLVREPTIWLGDLLAATCAEHAKIFLAACSAARDSDAQIDDDRDDGPGGEGGFTDGVRDRLVERGMAGGWIDAHVEAGHTTSNPYVRRFFIDPGDTFGAGWLVRPRSKLWGRWTRRLADRTHDDLRIRYTALEVEDLFAELA